ncbi:hypothetical protein ACFQPC_10790, partial [Herminiimonas glaciei]
LLFRKPFSRNTGGFLLLRFRFANALIYRSKAVAKAEKLKQAASVTANLPQSLVPSPRLRLKTPSPFPGRRSFHLAVSPFFNQMRCINSFAFMFVLPPEITS